MFRVIYDRVARNAGFAPAWFSVLAPAGARRVGVFHFIGGGQAAALDLENREDARMQQKPCPRARPCRPRTRALALNACMDAIAIIVAEIEVKKDLALRDAIVGQAPRLRSGK